MSIPNCGEGPDQTASGRRIIARRRQRGRPALWDPSRDEPDYFALMVMLKWAGEKPIKPYALARAALAHVREVFRFVAVLEKLRFLKLEEDALYGMLLELKAKIEAADEETRERWTQTGKEAFARGQVIDHSPYRYGDDLLHIKRLGSKFQDLLAHAELSLFIKDFPDRWTDDDVAGYCQTAEEKRQEALRIINDALA
jgi:hypothetical protein